jgi:predicted N-acyltransferase
VLFLKKKFLPLYTNVGRNITNGMSYKLDNLKHNTEFRKKVFLIYDVPTYFNLYAPSDSSKLKIKRINQYKGVLTNISKYHNFDNFLQNTFKSKSRHTLKRKRTQLESCFNISYSVYNGDISDNDYYNIAESLRNLITKRFSALGKSNSIIGSWDYYFDLMKSMIINKEAVMVTVNRDNKPIGMAFNFLSDNILFYAITTFDTDYLKYNIGHTTIMRIFEWCFENNINVIDFSKGVSEYKNRWKNEEYHFQCHILYDSGSVFTVIIANMISTYFKFKQYLRDKNLNSVYSKLKFLLNKT